MLQPNTIIYIYGNRKYSRKSIYAARSRNVLTLLYCIFHFDIKFQASMQHSLLQAFALEMSSAVSEIYSLPNVLVISFRYRLRCFRDIKLYGRQGNCSLPAVQNIFAYSHANKLPDLLYIAPGWLTLNNI